MTVENLKKAKEVLSRSFYLRQVDADKAREKGEELMSAEDINYLIEFQH